MSEAAPEVPRWKLHVCNREEGILSVRISEECAPLAFDDDSQKEFVDWGNADWPSDVEITQEASRQLGFPVSVEFSDMGDGLDESIYLAKPVGAP
jgi:hypothetical protein